MREKCTAVADPKLRSRMEEALDDLAGSGLAAPDEGSGLLSDLGERHARMIDVEAAAAKERAEKKRDAFGLALGAVDEADDADAKAAQEFRLAAGRTEAVARENLSFIADNGFAAFGPHFQEFMSALNRHRASVYPQAEADIELPKTLTEKDRALMAHGLASAIGGKVEDYFEVPGYALKRFDADGKDLRAKVRERLEHAGILRDGGFRMAALESRLRSNEEAA